MAKKLTEYESYEKNPFCLDNNWFKTFFVPAGDKINRETGEIQDGLKPHTSDAKPFVKLFTEGLEVLQQLTPKAARILYEVMKDLREIEDEVLVNASSYAKRFGLKNTRDVYAGIKELMDKDILCKKTEKDMYFINVRLIFKGSRIKFQRKK